MGGPRAASSLREEKCNQTRKTFGGRKEYPGPNYTRLPSFHSCPGERIGLLLPRKVPLIDPGELFRQP